MINVHCRDAINEGIKGYGIVYESDLNKDGSLKASGTIQIINNLEEVIIR